MNNIRLCAFADEAGSALSEQISAMKQNGVDGLEIRFVDGKNVTELTETQAREIRKQLDGNGLFVWSIGSPIGKISLEDDIDAHIELFRKTLYLSDILGAEHFRLFSFFVGHGDCEKRQEEVFDNFNKFIEISKNSDVLLCHENEKGIFGDTDERCLSLLNEFPTVRAVFDPANFVQCAVDTKKAWQLLSPYVEYMHIKDAKQNGGVVPAGKGDGNLKYLIDEYLKSGKNVLTVEPHLTVFDGLSKLETDGKRTEIGEFRYKTKSEAFSSAVDALKALLGE